MPEDYVTQSCQRINEQDYCIVPANSSDIAEIHAESWDKYVIVISGSERDLLSNALHSHAKEFQRRGFVQQGDTATLIGLTKKLSIDARGRYDELFAQELVEVRQLLEKVTEDNGD